MSELYEARVRGDTVCGIDIHDLLRRESMSLHAYLAATRHNMWASQVELELAARILHVGVQYLAKGD